MNNRYIGQKDEGKRGKHRRIKESPQLTGRRYKSVDELIQYETGLLFRAANVLNDLLALIDKHAGELSSHEACHRAIDVLKDHGEMARREQGSGASERNCL